MLPSSARRKNETLAAPRRRVPLGRSQAEAASADNDATPLPAASGESAPAPVPAPAVTVPPPAAPAEPVAEVAAPRRAVPLAPPTEKEIAAAREIALAAARPRLAARKAAAKARRPAIENKLAGASDSDEILQMLDVEVMLQRARRMSGATDKQREFLRVLSVLMLFGLLAAVVGTMWYLQTLRQGRTNVSRQRSQAMVVHGQTH